MGAFDGKVALITGASSGIGEALARELAAQGARVAVAARRKERLAELVAAVEGAGGQGLALACDVTRDGDVEEAVRATVERFGRLDVVVANAGFGVTGRFDQLRLDDYRRQLETNLFGVLRTAYGSIEELKRSRGALVLVGSVSGYLSAPATSAYAISKFGVRAFAEAVEGELRPHGVAVVQVNPGFIESEIRSVNNRGEMTAERDPIPRWLVMPRAVAARKIARAIAGRRREIVLTGHGKLGVFVARHMPWLLRGAIRLGAKWQPPKSKQLGG